MLLFNKFAIVNLIISLPLVMGKMTWAGEKSSIASPDARTTVSHTQSSSETPTHPRLTFLDQNEPEDKMDFLITRFPDEIRDQQSLPLKETVHDQTLLQLQGTGSPKEKLMQTLKQHVLAKVYDPSFFYTPPEHPSTHEEAVSKAIVATKQAQQHEKDEFLLYLQRGERSGLSPFEYCLLERQLNFQRTFGEDIVIAAQWIKHISQTHGRAPVLFPGRTPNMVRIAYEELCKLDSPTINLAQHVFHLSFSGNPDAITFRTGSFFQDAHNNLRNVVTPEALHFYETYMTQQGLDKIGNILYLVDILGSGSSLNSFLRVWRHYNIVHLKRPMPDVHFICLNKGLGYDHRNPGVWLFQQASGLLTFESRPTHGLRALSIPMTPLQLSHATVEKLLDHDFFQFYLSREFEFPAYKWHPRCKELLERGGEYHNEADAMLRPIFQTLLKVHKSLFDRKLAKPAAATTDSKRP